MSIVNTNHMRTRIKQVITHNSLFIEIIAIVIFGIALVSITTTMILVYISDEVYVETYSHANKKIITQINDEYYFLHEDIMEILGKCSTSQDVKAFLKKDVLTPQQDAEVVFRLTKGLRNTSVIGTDLSSNLLLVGKNGKTYYQNNGGLVEPYQDILDSEIVKNAIAHGKEVIYQYATDGFTSDLKDKSVIHVIKVIYGDQQEFLGIADVMINEQDFDGIYSPLIDETNNEFYVIDKNHRVLSSNQGGAIGETLDTYQEAVEDFIKSGSSIVRQNIAGKKVTLLASEMRYNDLRLVSIINESSFVDKVNRLSTVFFVCSLIALCTSGVVFLFIRKAMRPIRAISDKMEFITKGDFTHHIEEVGSGQVRELEETYNYMLDGLNRYVDELMKAQEEKRLSDIHALQMQINPHFIYNTLTSIKFLVWKGDKEKATDTINAFIELLRMTIGSKEDRITLEDEIINAQNYVKIQQTRYGEHIKCRLFIDEQTKALFVPKMMIQPFIENSFIHAFDETMNGVIDIYARILKDQLLIEIIDNGCGMEVTQVNALLMTKDKGKQFSGIGIKNVDERIKLLYGNAYGVSISSTLHTGTIVTICLPIIK